MRRNKKSNFGNMTQAPSNGSKSRKKISKLPATLFRRLLGYSSRYQIKVKTNLKKFFKIQGIDENFFREIDIIKNNQSKLLEMKDTFREIQNTMKSFNNRLAQVEERISEQEYQAFELTQSDLNIEK